MTVEVEANRSRFRWTPLALLAVLAAFGTFAFSILLEIVQTQFPTGHCRARDLIPNAIGIAAAALLVWAFVPRTR